MSFRVQVKDHMRSQTQLSIIIVVTCQVIQGQRDKLDYLLYHVIVEAGYSWQVGHAWKVRGSGYEDGGLFQSWDRTDARTTDGRVRGYRCIHGNRCAAKRGAF